MIIVEVYIDRLALCVGLHVGLWVVDAGHVLMLARLCTRLFYGNMIRLNADGCVVWDGFMWFVELLFQFTPYPHELVHHEVPCSVHGNLVVPMNSLYVTTKLVACGDNRLLDGRHFVYIVHSGLMLIKYSFIQKPLIGILIGWISFNVCVWLHNLHGPKFFPLYALKLLLLLYALLR